MISVLLRMINRECDVENPKAGFTTYAREEGYLR